MHIIPKYARIHSIKYNNENPHPKCHWNITKHSLTSTHTLACKRIYSKMCAPAHGINIDINVNVSIERISVVEMLDIFDGSFRILRNSSILFQFPNYKLSLRKSNQLKEIQRESWQSRVVCLVLLLLMLLKYDIDFWTHRLFASNLKMAKHNIWA